MVDDVKEFNVYLSAELIREVKHYGVETEQSLSAVVADARRAYLDEHRIFFSINPLLVSSLCLNPSSCSCAPPPPPLALHFFFFFFCRW